MYIYVTPRFRLVALWRMGRRRAAGGSLWSCNLQLQVTVRNNCNSVAAVVVVMMCRVVCVWQWDVRVMFCW